MCLWGPDYSILARTLGEEAPERKFVGRGSPLHIRTPNAIVGEGPL